MKNRYSSFIVIFISLLFACKNQPGETRKKDSVVSVSSVDTAVKHISILNPEALSLLDSNATIEVIAEGYKWSEGPVYISDSDYLLFSDVPANRIYKWKQGNGAAVYLEPS